MMNPTYKIRKIPLVPVQFPVYIDILSTSMINVLIIHITEMVSLLSVVHARANIINSNAYFILMGIEVAHFLFESVCLGIIDRTRLIHIDVYTNRIGFFYFLSSLMRIMEVFSIMYYMNREDDIINSCILTTSILFSIFRAYGFIYNTQIRIRALEYFTKHAKNHLMAQWIIDVSDYFEMWEAISLTHENYSSYISLLYMFMNLSLYVAITYPIYFNNHVEKTHYKYVYLFSNMFQLLLRCVALFTLRLSFFNILFMIKESGTIILAEAI